MVNLVTNRQLLDDAMGEAFRRCRHRLLISTADIKNVQVPPEIFPLKRGSRSVGILDVFRKLSDNGIQIHLLHSSSPSGPLLEDMKQNGIPENLTMRLCPRNHSKAIIADGRFMYLGSANLTGAGLGAKSDRNRNFEVGICTDQVDIIDTVVDMLEGVFQGNYCDDCGRRKHCPEPLEEPDI